MNYVNVVSKISKAIVRRSSPIDVASLREVSSVTRNFGFDRGMPVDRYYISRFLNANRHLVNGQVLEVAERTYSQLYGAKDSKCWILDYSPVETKVDGDAEIVTGSLTRMDSLPANFFDCFICTQTLNSIFELKEAIETIRNLLKPNGTALITLPGLTQLSSYDAERWGDYWRFTPASARRMFTEVFCQNGDNVEVAEFGNLIAAIGLLRGVAVEDLPDRSLLEHNDADYPVVTGVVVMKSPEILTIV